MNFSASAFGALLYETLRVGVGKASRREGGSIVFTTQIGLL
ncbi:hypothetical protein [Nostoc sp.]